MRVALHDLGRAVDERVGAGLAAGEGHGGHAPHLGPVGQVSQVDLDVVALDGEQCGTLLGFGLGQAADSH